MELQRLYVTLALDSSDFQAGMKTVTGIVAAGAIAASAAVAAVAIDGVKAAIDMEEQMSGIAAIFSTTVDEIQPLGDLIKELGLDPNLKVNATEAADAIEMLGRNGLTMAEILEGAAESTVLLANSTGADFATAANIGTDAMALFNIEAKDMNEAVDGITAVTVNSKFSINDYALALAQGGGVASSVGVTFNDFNATIAGISPLFKSGSDAGTSLKTMLLRLNPQTEKAADMMQELGLMTAEGTSAFFDAEGNMKSMAEVSGLMQEAFGGLSEAQRITTMQTIFGTDAMRAAVGLMNLGEEGFRELTDTMSQTDAMAAAATRMDNLSGAMEIFGGIVDTAKLSLGQALLPVIRIFVDWLIVLADTWMPRVEAAFAALAIVLSSFFTNMSEGMTVMDAFLLAIQQFIPPELYARLIEIRDTITQLWEQVVILLTPIWEAIAAFVSWKDILIVVGIAIAATVIPILFSLISSLVAVAAPILVLIGVVALLRTAWESDWMGIQGVTQTVWANIQTFVTTAWEAIQVIVNAVLAVVGPAIETFTNEAEKSLGKFDTLLPALGALWEALEPIVMFVLEVIGAQLVVFLGVAVSVFAGIAAALGPLVDAFVGAVNGIIQILTGAAQFITGFVDLVVALFQGNSEAVQAAWQQMGEGLRTIVNGIVEGNIALFVGLFDAVIAFTGGFVDGIIAYFDNLDTELTSTISGTMQAVADFFEDGWAEVVDIFESVYDDIIDTAVAITEGIFAAFDLDWASIGTAIIDGIAGAIKAGASRVISAAVNVARAAINAMKAALGISSPSAVAAAEIGAPIPEGIAQGITANVSLIINALKDAADQVETEGVKEFASAVKAVADSILKISEAIGVVGNMVFPAQFEEKMRILDYLIFIMITTVKKAATHFDEETLKLVSLYAKTTKDIANAIIEVGEAFETIAEMRWPKPGTWTAIWHGLDWLIFIMMTTIKKTALKFDEPTLKLVDTYAKTVKKVSDAVVAFGEALDIIAAIKWPKPGTWEGIFFGLDWMMLVMVNTIKDAARLFDGPTLALIETYAKAVKGVSNTLSAIIEDVTVAIGHIETLINKDVPGGLKDVTMQMIMILQNLTTPALSIGLDIGDAIVFGIISAIQTGMSAVNAAVADLIGGVEFSQPEFPQLATATGTAVGGASGTGGRSVVIENGAFPITINDSMDAEEFKFNVLEILRELTE